MLPLTGLKHSVLLDELCTTMFTKFLLISVAIDYAADSTPDVIVVGQNIFDFG